MQNTYSRVLNSVFSFTIVLYIDIIQYPHAKYLSFVLYVKMYTLKDYMFHKNSASYCKYVIC